jgi:hypothetical protein
MKGYFRTCTLFEKTHADDITQQQCHKRVTRGGILGQLSA